MTDKLSGYSTTPASNNAASPDGWPEGMTAGSVNNSDREFAARVREFYEDSQWIDYGHAIVSSTGTSIKLSGDVTATYTAGRAIRVNQSASQDGWINASAYSAPDTSITVTGFTVAAPTQVELGAVKDHTVLPNNLSITVASLSATSVYVSGTLTATSVYVSGTLTASNTSFASAAVGTLTVTKILNSGGDPFTGVLNIDAKTSGTAATWTWPANVYAVDVIIVGGGGNGGNGAVVTGGGGGGGGGGGTARVRIAKVVGLNTITYTVGAAGSASTVVYNSVTYTGAAGAGGSNGSAGSGGAGGNGGSSTNGTINAGGGGGSGGGDGGSAAGGMGGSSLQGSGGGGGVNGGNGKNGGGYGAGGGGGGYTGTGGNGSAGIVIFKY